MAEENKARVYGMADQANRNPPASQGLRGEKSSRTQRAEQDFSHLVALESGRTVQVSEGNGVAFAEASGKVERPSMQELEIEFTPESESRPDARTPLLIGALLAGAGVALYAADRWLRSRTERNEEVRFGDLADDRESLALVPVQELPHRQQPASVETEISSSASRT